MRCFLCSALWQFSERFRHLHILGQRYQGLYWHQHSPFVFYNLVYNQMVHMDHNLSFEILWCLEDNSINHWLFLDLLVECVRCGFRFSYIRQNYWRADFSWLVILMKRLLRHLLGHLELGIYVDRSTSCFYEHKHRHFLDWLEVFRSFSLYLLMVVSSKIWCPIGQIGSLLVNSNV